MNTLNDEGVQVHADSGTRGIKQRNNKHVKTCFLKTFIEAGPEETLQVKVR